MQVSSVNNVKIYNLSHGKSLPEWLSDRKKRDLQKKDVDIQRRIELIQDFEMPTVCTSIRVSRDGQFILAAGTYKPRVRCYDTYQLSLKFERCLESDVVTFEVLSEDYSKLVFLHIDRYVEFHSQHGHYYKTRIPKFGRDFSYHYPSCDLYFVGASSEVFRLNLEQGRFLNSLQTDAAVEGLPSVSALKFNGSLGMAVGTSTGQVLVYDLRSSRPLLVKDHYYGLPIKSLHFHNPLDLVLSADSKIIKMWNKDNGKVFSSIEPQAGINDVCLYPGSGMLFTANEHPKMNTFYIPALGPAPRWCSFLDNLTEELEENPESTIYDDYKFVTRKDLENLGLTHLIGSPLLRAYMHGFFMDIRLYHKVKTMVNPFAYEEYRKDKIRQKIEESRAQRVQLKKLPKVNKELAMKLMEESELPIKKKKKKGNAVANLLTDDRFKVMFENPDYQVDERSEEFRLLNPIVSKVGEKRRKQLNQLVEQEEQDEENEEMEGRGSSEEEDSSDDDKSWVQEVREQRRLLRAEERDRNYNQRKERRQQDRETSLQSSNPVGNRQQEPQNQNQSQPRFYQIKAGEEFRSFSDAARKQKMQKTSLEERLQQEESSGMLNLNDTAVGSKQLTFTLKKDDKDAFYVADLGDVLKKHLRWLRVLPRVTPFYAVKCNDSKAVVTTLASLGAGFDCASKTEIQIVQSVGVEPSRIIYANPCKQVSQIKYASAHGVQMMTFDSEVELMKVARSHDNAKLVLRIATDDSKAVCRLSVKFGATLKSSRLLLERAKELGLDVIGVSFHVGSGCTDPETYSQAISDARCVFDMGAELGYQMTLLDIGGGFPGSDDTKLKFEEIAAVINPALDKYFPVDCGVRIIAEPGRYYVASAYTLAVNIIAKKVIMKEQSASDEEEDGANDRTLMYYVNDGVYGSFNCILYDHAHVLPTLHKKPKPDERMYPCSMWGPTCDGLDRIVEQCNLPDLQVGDWLLFENMGAYTVAASSTFNGFQKPDIYYIMSRTAWQCMQQIRAQGIILPAEEQCTGNVPSHCGRESTLDVPAKPCPTQVL
ncbi:nucleolar 10 [Labeo rohita]|uniref:Nucleolar 10 n=2 Tax=Labeonini TaxID=2743697 RepID=A0A498MS07_LABRO|nr:nucleolar 10 [Labeo rohita]